MSTPTSPVVVLERLGHRFGEQVALDGVSARIRPGEFVAVVGRSGAGKTTLLRCLSRAVVPTAGAVWMGEQDLRPLSGLVGRLPHLAGGRRWAALLRFWSPSQREVALRCLDHVGLLARAWQRTPARSRRFSSAIRTMKNLSRFELKIARNFTRSSSGTLGS
jgi:ABC-type phosphate/phosphonate transport system ATPase subunit